VDRGGALVAQGAGRARLHEGDCRKVCLVPHVLDTVIKGRAVETEVPLGPDCTRCGLCVDTCPTGSLSFEIKGLSKLG